LAAPGSPRQVRRIAFFEQRFTRTLVADRDDHDGVAVEYTCKSCGWRIRPPPHALGGFGTNVLPMQFNQNCIDPEGDEE
jgi:hypothetical protein